MTTQNITINDILTRLNSVQAYLNEHPTSAQQDLHLHEPAEKQLHHLKQADGHPELFVLVTAVHNGYCDVIPGSFEAMQGGPDDIVLPQSVMGDYIILAMDKATPLPAEELDYGFARLDDKTFQRVMSSLNAYKDDTDGETFPYALPYIGVSDERIAYHAQLDDILNAARARALKHRYAFALMAQPQVALAAASSKKDIELTYAVADAQLTIHVVYSWDDRRFYVNVFDADENFSTALDGCQLWTTAPDTVLGTIQNGELVTAPWTGDPEACKLFFTDAQGHELKGELNRQ